MDSAVTLSAQVGVRAACDSLGVPRATFYRQRPLAGPQQESEPLAPKPRPTPARALALDEREQVLSVLHSEQFQDCAPAAIHAQLLDEGRYLCSPRTMYRILSEEGESTQRGSQLVHPRPNTVHLTFLDPQYDLDAAGLASSAWPQVVVAHLPFDSTRVASVPA